MHIPVAKVLGLLTSTLFFWLFIGVLPAQAVFHYRPEQVGSIYRISFSLFAVIMAILAILFTLIHLTTRKGSLIRAIEKRDLRRMAKIIKRSPHLIDRVESTDWGEISPLTFAAHLSDDSRAYVTAAYLIHHPRKSRCSPAIIG
ncbi:hypothetical protein [Rhabdochromatium marinum]|uniref:hypothetical protein n=1 Tax=Rhabdochromatium marinum TaxID=48729 RepID=UPI001904BD9F|nr:hypothetical protein [Rhabdochromatium marinum]MBK1650512.1 hypothetical protein [Rhabdochromatium marinum]